MVWLCACCGQVPYGFCHCKCGERAPLAPENNAGRGWVKGEPLRYVHGHNKRGPLPESVLAEYAAKMAGSPVPPGYCWCGCGARAPVAPWSVRRRGWIRGRPLRWIAGHQGWAQPRCRPVAVAPGTCSCGCNGLLTERSKDGKFRKYLEGHSPQYARRLDASDMTQASIDAFWTNVRIADNGMCLEWTGVRTRQGYGVWTDLATRRHYRAHRLAYAILRGPIAAGVQIHHRCDVAGRGPGCIIHLFSGSQSDNLYDAAANGLMPRKLSASQVLEIRALCRAGVSQIVLAEKFGICRKHVGRIVHDRTWLHLVDPEAPPLPTVRPAARPRTRKAACPSGHAYTPENTAIGASTGRRRCRACHRLVSEKHRRRMNLGKKRLTPEQRQDIARRAAAARWGGKQKALA